MKFLIFLLMLCYIVSPVDLVPAVPVDDIVVMIAGTSYLLTPKED